MKFKYIGVAPKTATQGYNFIKGEATEVIDKNAISRLTKNPFFEEVKVKPVANEGSKISKAAKELAEEAGLDINTVIGTGANGAINITDIREAIANQPKEEGTETEAKKEVE